MSYLRRTVVDDIAFWRMAATPIDDLRRRAGQVVADAGIGSVVETEALPGAGSAPGVTIPSVGISVEGDTLAELRAHEPPVIARTRDDHTVLDLRSVDPGDDPELTLALRALA